MPENTPGTTVIVAAYILGVIAAAAGWIALRPLGLLAAGTAALALFIAVTYAAGQPAAKMAVRLDESRWFR